MPEFRIEPMPSRKLGSDTVVYYVKDQATNTLITKFDTNVSTVDNIEGWQSFSTEQKLELQNYFANIRFVVDKLHLPAKLNRAYRISLPDPLQTALIDLFEKSQANNINFDPMTAMLNGLLNHISTTEKRLKAIGEEPVLSQFDMKINSNNTAERDKETRKYTKKIFKRLLIMQKGLEQYAKMAHELYDKETNLNSSTIAKYAEGKSKPSQWSVSCALTVLGKEKEDILAIVPIQALIFLWLSPLKFSGKLATAEKAIKLFQATFKLDEKECREATGIIKNEILKLT